MSRPYRAQRYGGGYSLGCAALAQGFNVPSLQDLKPDIQLRQPVHNLHRLQSHGDAPQESSKANPQRGGGRVQGNVIADRCGFIAGGAEGEGAGQLRQHLNPAFLAVFLFENVFLSGGELQLIEKRLQIVGVAVTQILWNKLHEVRLVMPN